MKHDFAEGLGFCQAAPPALLDFQMEEGIGFFGIWPVTAGTDWCGSFQTKPTPRIFQRSNTNRPSKAK